MGIAEIVEDIKKQIPSVKTVLAFYNDGTVFYSGFKKEAIPSVPDLGDACAKIIENFKNIYDMIKSGRQDLGDYSYKQITFSSNGLGIMIIHLGEESNIALFFDKLSINKVNLGCIETDLSQIEDIMDTTDSELEKIGYDKENVTKKLAENEEFLKKVPGAAEILANSPAEEKAAGDEDHSEVENDKVPATDMENEEKEDDQ